MAEAIQLLITTVFTRPYVLTFPAFLTAATFAIGRRRTSLFTGIAWMAFTRYRRWGAAYGFVGRRVLP